MAVFRGRKPERRRGRKGRGEGKDLSVRGQGKKKPGGRGSRRERSVSFAGGQPPVVEPVVVVRQVVPENLSTQAKRLVRRLRSPGEDLLIRASGDCDLLEAPDMLVRIAGKTHPNFVFNELRAIFSDSGADIGLRRRAMQVMASVAKANAIEPLAAQLFDEKEHIRNEAAKLLGEIGSVDAGKHLPLSLLGDGSETVKSTAFYSLRQVNEKLFRGRASKVEAMRNGLAKRGTSRYLSEVVLFLTGACKLSFADAGKLIVDGRFVEVVDKKMDGYLEANPAVHEAISSL